MAYTLINADCFSWLAAREENSITAIVTDPPYAVKEYTETELEKQRAGRGGVWRIPPAFDGHIRKALPRFSVINDDPKNGRMFTNFSCVGQFWRCACLCPVGMFSLRRHRFCPTC